MKHVYFMRPIGMNGPVKVGCSKTPENRLKSLDIWSPFPLEIIASVEGDGADERALHWHLREERQHGEWFSWSPKLARLIAFVRNNRLLPPLEKPPYGKTGMGRGRNPNRDRELSRTKNRLSRRMRSAEIHAWSRWDCYSNRPQWVKDLQRSWQGAFTPLPDDVVQKIEAYISVLLAFPKNTKTWAQHYTELTAKTGKAA